MTCPRCNHEMQAGQGFSVCLHCGHQIRHEDDLAALPSLLAIPWSELRREQYPVMRLHWLCHTVEILKRLLTITAIEEFRHRFPDESFPAPVLAVLQRNISLPTFGKWWEMLRALAEELPVDDAAAVVPELRQFIRDDLRPKVERREGIDREQALWENIIDLRNRLAHGGGMLRAKAEGFLHHWEPWLDSLLPHLRFLAEADLIFVGLKTGAVLIFETRGLEPYSTGSKDQGGSETGIGKTIGTG